MLNICFLLIALSPTEWVDDKHNARLSFPLFISTFFFTYLLYFLFSFSTLDEICTSHSPSERVPLSLLFPSPLRSLLFLVLFVSPPFLPWISGTSGPSPRPGSPRLPWLRTREEKKKRLKKCTYSFTLKPFVSPLFSFPLGLFRIILNWCFRFPLAKQTIEFYSSFVVLRLSDYGLMTRRFVCCLSSSIFSGLDSRMGLSSRLLCFCLHRSRVLCLISFATSPFRSDDDIQFLILIVQLFFSMIWVDFICFLCCLKLGSVCLYSPLLPLFSSATPPLTCWLSCLPDLPWGQV